MIVKNLREIIFNKIYLYAVNNEINNYKIDDNCKILIKTIRSSYLRRRLWAYRKNKLLTHNFFKVEESQVSKLNIFDIETNNLLNNPENLEIEAKSFHC